MHWYNVELAHGMSFLDILHISYCKHKSTLNTNLPVMFPVPWTADFRTTDIRHSELQSQNHQILTKLHWHTGHSDIISMFYILIVTRAILLIRPDLKSVLQRSLTICFRWLLNAFLGSQVNPNSVLWSLVNNAWQCTTVIISKYQTR